VQLLIFYLSYPKTGYQDYKTGGMIYEGVC